MLRLGAAVAALTLTAGVAVAGAPVTRVEIDGVNVFNESMHASKNGTLYFGASGTGNVYRARPGETKATKFIDGKENGYKSTLGVFADEKSNTLWLCSVSPRGEPAQPELSALKAFNLRTGKFKRSYPIGAGSTCNDVDVAANGDVYVAETSGGRVLILRAKGGNGGLQELAVTPGLRGADGIAIIEGGDMIVNTVTSGRLFRVTPAGVVTELKPSMTPLRGADGMRSSGGNRVLMSESGAGRITEVTINGTDAQMRLIKDGQQGATGMALVGNMVWINNGQLRGKPEGPFFAEAVPLGR